MGIALLAMAQHQGELGEITIGASGAAQSPSLVSYLATRAVSLTDVDDAEAAVRSRRVPAALVVDDRYAERFTGSRPAEVTLLFNSIHPESERYATHVRAVLSDYGRAVGETRLVLRGIAPDAINPMRVWERDFATSVERAGRAFATVPMFLLLAAFIGGMSVAADVAAGERERGSLESLLLHPVTRPVIVGGKWVAVAGAALATVMVAVVISYGVLQHPRLQQLDLPIGLTVSEAVALTAVLSPLAVAATAVQLWLAFRARTSKEAHTTLSMLIFVPMIPGFLLAFGTLQPAPWMALAPMMGQYMLTTELVRGAPPALGTALGLSVTTLGVAVVAYLAAVWQLGREHVLRRVSM
jgi:sodium transport system permease protein